MSDDLKLSIANGVATVELNRPQVMNAMTFGMWARLLEYIQEIEHDVTVRCVVLSGAGPNFCAGQDVSEFAELATLTPVQVAIRLKRELDKTNPLFLAMERIPQPVIASVRGVAAGGGLSLVAAADLVVASDTASFFAAQIKLGALPDASLSFNLRRAIGIKKAKQYCFLGDSLSAATALELGLVNWVVPDESLDSTTKDVVRRLVATSPVALARTKARLNSSFNCTLADHAAAEPLDVGACVMAPDFLTNVQSFVARRRSK